MRTCVPQGSAVSTLLFTFFITYFDCYYEQMQVANCTTHIQTRFSLDMLAEESSVVPQATVRALKAEAETNNAWTGDQHL